MQGFDLAFGFSIWLKDVVCLGKGRTALGEGRDMIRLLAFGFLKGFDRRQNFVLRISND